MKSGKPRKAPKVTKYDVKRNFMKEYDAPPKRSSPQQPLKKKRLSN